MIKRLVSTVLVLLLSVCLLELHAAKLNAAPRELTVDVAIYGTTTSGIGALRGLQLARYRYPAKLSVALITAGSYIESPLVHGLCIEDLYGYDAVSGFYKEFRNGVISYYRERGVATPHYHERLMYGPEAARSVLGWFLDYNGLGRSGVNLVYGRLSAAGPDSITLEDGTIIRARFMVDASPEGDLGRLLGASYMIGHSEDVYGPDNPPPTPSAANQYETAPQAMSTLLTLKVAEGASKADPIAQLKTPLYDPSTYDPGMFFWEVYRSGFATSWSMSHVLPGGQRELNEPWSDYLTPEASFKWTMEPQSRPAIRAAMTNWTINEVRYLQEHGYPHVGLAQIPTRPYVREGVRFRGRDLYRGTDIDREVWRDGIAFSRYQRYDRHDPVHGAVQDPSVEEVYVPMGSLIVPECPNLLVTTGVSCDSSAYNSAVRMEPIRANMGGAAGIMIAIANAKGITPDELHYQDVREELLQQGYRID